jgi:hypothetical protein
VVLADGDVLRGERLTRSLLAELVSIDGLDVQRATGNRVADPLAKGGGAADASLWIFLTASVTASAQVLVAAIQAWAERERHRAVRVTSGDQTIEIPSDVTEAQERILRMVLPEGDR